MRKHLRIRLGRMGSRNGLLAALYYLCISKSFRREMRAVLAGKAAFEEADPAGIGDVSLLRRSIHRIEKGLTMRPRRPFFAGNYIEKTVELYENHVDRGDPACAGTRWYTGVLSAYFQSVELPEELLDLRARFEKARSRVDIDEGGLTRPYPRSESEQIDIPDFESLLRLARRRRSIRWFKDEPVDRARIEKAMEVARFAPSACNRQPFQFFCFADPKRAREVAGLPMGTAGYAEGVPMFVVLVGDLSAYAAERDRHLIYIDAALAAMGFIYALETLGLASCPINWPDIEEREIAMAEALKLKWHQRPIMCIAVGNPDSSGLVAYSEKKGVSELLRFVS